MGTVVTRHLLIAGKVQGVGYRAWLERTAGKAGLSGWVRNRQEGTVEALLHGAQPDVEAVIERARKGPIMARVDNIAINEGAVYDGPRVFITIETV